ncbi:MAG: peptidoglycan DD-metalloendopeptidase family protein [Firmicutes bacterium]|nr:peptidoglycan DD-metalloendopeptidase family protein [Bacillota bacterium]
MNKMRLGKRAILIFTALVCAFMLMLASSADDSATSDTDASDDTTIKKMEQQIADIQAKIDAQNEFISSATDELESFYETKEYYDNLLALYTQLADANEALAAELEVQIAALEEEIAAQQALCDELYEQIKERIRISYESGDTSYIEMLFEADSIIDFLIGLDYSISIMQYDSRKLAEYDEAKSVLDAEMATLLEEKTKQETTSAQYAAALAQYEASSAEMEQYISETLASISDSEALIEDMEASLDEASSELSAWLDDYIARNGATTVTTEDTTTETETETEAETTTTVAETTTAEENTTVEDSAVEESTAEDTTGEDTTAADDTTADDATAGDATASDETTGDSGDDTDEPVETDDTDGGDDDDSGTSSGVSFIWPLPTQYTTITSYFGARPDPFTGAASNHGAIDIYAPSGTDIYAAASGTVILSQSYSTYGNCIIIDHGNGIFTLYAHASKLLVSVGDTVTQGQVIAYVGMTGRATGYHLHFEVRLGSTRVDPLGYVSVP